MAQTKSPSSFLRYMALPGTDIFTRRRTSIERNWRRGPRRVLDAGFGNGWFAYRAYRSGASVTALTNQFETVHKARALFNGYLRIPEDRLRFLEMNLYDVDKLNDRFDEIICYETLEHIRDDRRVCTYFYELLQPNGLLHLCCPNAEHPRWMREILDLSEKGGHVRHGYTEYRYRQLLEPIGFRIDRVEGVGGPILVALQENWQAPLRRWFGEAGAAVVAALAMPFVRFDPARPRVPFSVYVRAQKPE